MRGFSKRKRQNSDLFAFNNLFYILLLPFLVRIALASFDSAFLFIYPSCIHICPCHSLFAFSLFIFSYLLVRCLQVLLGRSRKLHPNFSPVTGGKYVDWHVRFTRPYPCDTSSPSTHKTCLSFKSGHTHKVFVCARVCARVYARSIYAALARLRRAMVK